MRTQVFVLPVQLFEYEEIKDNKNFNVLLESGFLGGFVINITDDHRLLPTLERFAKSRHYTAVKYLDTDEPWPTAKDRREEFLRENPNAQEVN